jgi:hypothetical protein
MQTSTMALERSTLMSYPTAAPRLAPRKAALALVVAATTALTFAPGAGAAIFRPTPGVKATSDPTSLQNAIISANSSPDAQNTIVLSAGRYAPTDALPNITKNLTITGDHALQAATSTAGPPLIDGSAETNANQDLIVIPANVNVTLEGFLINGAAQPGFYAINDAGNLKTWSMALSGNNGTNLLVSGAGTATINESTLDNDGNAGLKTNGGTTVLNNSDVVSNFAGGIDQSLGGIVRVNNTIIANNVNPITLTGSDCTGPPTSNDKSQQSDGSCGTAVTSSSTLNLNSSTQNEGPTPTISLGTGSSAIGAGDAAICQRVDQRFFVHSGTGCDIGSYQTGSTRDTSPPTCVVTRTNLVTVPNQQDVTVTDADSGLGPEAGLATDAQAIGTINPGDAITNLTITNGSVAFTPFTSPSRGGLVLTATRGSNPAVGSTSWKFTANDWAGNRMDCH